MAEELELELENEEINRSEKRFKDLSSKVRDASEERDAEKARADVAEAAKLAAENKVEFLNSFSDVSTKYQGASEFRNEIEEKVQKGYSVEDATVAVLNAQGKLVPQVEEVPLVPAAGGSATVILPDGSIKGAGEMTQVERREALNSPERAAELESILRNGR